MTVEKKRGHIKEFIFILAAIATIYTAIKSYTPSVEAPAVVSSNPEPPIITQEPSKNADRTVVENKPQATVENTAPFLKVSGYELLSCTCETKHPDSDRAMNINTSYVAIQCISQKARIKECRLGDKGYMLCNDEWGNPLGIASHAVCI